MNKTLYFIFLLLVLEYNCFSQITNPTPNYKEIDPKAKEILDKVAQKNKGYSSIYAEFGMVLENKKNNMKESQKGYIWIKSPKYKIDLSASRIYYDGKTQWVYNKKAKEVNISEPDTTEDNTLNPAKIFDIYKKDFKIRYIREKFEKNRALYEIELYPKDVKKVDFTKISLKIDKDKMQIFSMKRCGKDGTDFYLELIKIIPNPEISDTTFFFDKSKYPKVEIIDLRE
ncbi:MAG: outer membrane lipoprotein carrier protein LolA [Bacteroidales bacterium]|nr:outer membrane lipoprotein carrier protein LolA [Bacteroidales bacterium]